MSNSKIIKFNSKDFTPGVQAVIVNYNGGEDIIKCIESLQNQTYSPIEIVVVDNLSQDNSVKQIKAKFKEVNVIENNENSGWGIGCNLGMKISNSKYITLINNDAWLEPNCIEEMVKAIELDSNFGSCASKVILGTDKQVLEVCGLNIVADGSSCGRGRLEPVDNYNQQEEVFCANDCCCIYKREMINDIGDYDPDFFIYCDETDIGYKHQLAGWKCIYNPKALAYHAHSKAAGSFSSFKAYYVERNRILLLFKYFPYFWIPYAFLLSFLRYLMQIFLVSKGKGSLARYTEEISWLEGLWTLIKAHFSAFKLFPRMMIRRWGMSNIRRISHKDFKELFLKYGISLKQLSKYE